jgi:NAD(P)-dependent dehydrogenase (short-subunit alcohol dehydrogenase family)
LALACARRQARVLLLDINLQGLEEVCEEIEAEGLPAPGICQFDLATAGPGSFQELVDAFTGAYGALDGLVHCAAHFSGLQPLDHVPAEDWLKTVQVNLNSAWLLTTACLSSLLSSPASVVVFVLDDEKRSKSAYWGAYSIAKAGARSMAEMLAQELENSNCRVFGVDPGPMRTGLRATAYLAEDPAKIPSPEHAAEYLARLILGEGGSTATIQRVPPA